MCCASVAFHAYAQSDADAKKPNILVIWGDDIGIWNISHNSRGMMGYKTPNLDRLATEGVAFTDYYGQQSCTAGRAAVSNKAFASPMSIATSSAVITPMLSSFSCGLTRLALTV
ncbi:MAG: sulfatase-like hydrolase/transferase, partial [Planctomycetota bacterium]